MNPEEKDKLHCDCGKPKPSDQALCAPCAGLQVPDQPCWNTDDRIYGTKFVYCIQHCRVHETGWCTVAVIDKIALLSKTQRDAEIEWDFKKTTLGLEK